MGQRRPRGQSPYRVERLLETPEQLQCATRFASLCKSAGVLPAVKLADVRRLFPGIEKGELLCSAYEALKRDLPSLTLSIEQAILLIIELASGEAIELLTCSRCSTLAIVDRLDSKLKVCTCCGNKLERRSSFVDESGSDIDRQVDARCRKFSASI